MTYFQFSSSLSPFASVRQSLGRLLSAFHSSICELKHIHTSVATKPSRLYAIYAFETNIMRIEARNSLNNGLKLLIPAANRFVWKLLFVSSQQNCVEIYERRAQKRWSEEAFTWETLASCRPLCISFPPWISPILPLYTITMAIIRFRLTRSIVFGHISNKCGRNRSAHLFDKIQWTLVAILGRIAFRWVH